MHILGLDLGIRTGWARGVPGSCPTSGEVDLKRRDEAPAIAAQNLGCFLRTLFREFLPDLVCVEDYMPPHKQMSGPAAVTGILLAGALRAIAGVYGVPIRAVHNATVRKHFIGVGRMGDRKLINQAVHQRAVTLGYLSADDRLRSWDRANALAVWDYACAVHGRAVPEKLMMFGETAA